LSQRFPRAVRLWLSILLLLAVCASVQASLTVSSGGKPRCVIVQEPDASQPEIHAVQELAQTLEQITGGTFSIQTNASDVPENAIIVGPGPASAALFPDIDLTRFGSEEYVMRVKNGRLLLAGGQPRGTLYAVNRFLQEQCGVRWWTPWATNIPHHATLRVPDLDVRSQPAFEYRSPYIFSGFDPLWKTHNGANGESRPIPSNLGGCITYKGFCHTFYPLVPPEKYFAEHPEWYSLVNGKRTHDYAQLCLSNPHLRDFVVERVKTWLREAPDAKIISLTQNDNAGWCECPKCKALDDAEGSHAGTMLNFVNYVAEKIEPEFPNVMVDTFAYQYTRKPPKTIKPRRNVIVRLCSIECDFREPFDHPSNAAFLADLAGWSKICPHLYVWDYITDFSDYMSPFPDWFTLGPNLRILQQYGVEGVFEEGSYGGLGSEMAEMRSWVLAQLLWNPRQDDHALINEFLEGYYGPAAKPIHQYLDLMYTNSKGFYLRCYTSKQPPYLEFAPLAAAEKLWQQAEAAVANDPEKFTRVRIAHLPVRTAWLNYWTGLRRECWEQNAVWPLPDSRKAVAEEWRKVAAGVPGKDWTVVRVMNEGGLTVDQFLARFATDTPDTNGPPPIKRSQKAPPPADLQGILARTCIDLQDNLAALDKPGEFAEIRPDPAASDHRAVWMPGNHEEWAFRIPGSALPPKAFRGKWKVYAVARVDKPEKAAPESVAFSAGVRDNKARSSVADAAVKACDVGADYHSYLVGTVELNPDRDIWVAPSKSGAIKDIYVDRVYLVPAT
jgi:hypothetical protein